MDIFSFHHFGLATKDPKKTDIVLKALGYRPGDKVFDNHQKVFAQAYLHDSQPMIEVLSDDGEKSPLSNYLAKSSSLIYHICYRASDLNGALKAMKEDGLNFIILSENKPSELFKGHSVSFIYIRDFGMIEIIEQDSKTTGTSR